LWPTNSGRERGRIRSARGAVNGAEDVSGSSVSLKRLPVCGRSMKSMIIIAEKIETRDRGCFECYQAVTILLGAKSRIFKGTLLRKSSYSWLRADKLRFGARKGW